MAVWVPGSDRSNELGMVPIHYSEQLSSTVDRCHISTDKEDHQTLLSQI